MAELQDASEKQRATGYGEHDAQLVKTVERFKKTAASVSVLRDGRGAFEADYSDPKTCLVLRVYQLKGKKGEQCPPDLQWFFTRRGRPAGLLSPFVETRAEALKLLRLMLSGDEEVIRLSFVLDCLNTGVGSNDCECFDEESILQDFTLAELEKEAVDIGARLDRLGKN